MDVTHQQLAEALKNARPNLFGSIEAIREVELRKRTANPFPHQKLYKRYHIRNVTTMGKGAYTNAINNQYKALYDGTEPPFVSSGKRSGVDWWDDSKTILVHDVDETRKYISLRQVRNTIFLVRFEDSEGRQYDRSSHEQYFYKKETLAYQREQLLKIAAKQKLPVERIVRPFHFKMENLLQVTYGGITYNVIPQPTESVSRAANFHIMNRI